MFSFKKWGQPYLDSIRISLGEDRDGTRKPRSHVLLGNLCANMVSTLSEGVFYTTLLLILFTNATSVEYNNYMTFISTIVSFCALSQLLSPFLFEKLQRRKPLIFALRGVYYGLRILVLPLLCIVELPLLSKVILFATSAAVSIVCSSVVSPALSDWHIHSIPNYCRSDYLSVYNILNNVLTDVSSLALALCMDYFKANNIALFGLVLFRGIALAFITLEYWNFHRIPEPVYNPGQNKFTLWDIVKAPFSSKAFLLMVLVQVGYSFACGFQGSFYSVYLINKTGANLSYTYLSIASLAGIPCSILTLPLWSRVIHKRGWLPVLSVSMALFSVCYVVNMFVTHETGWMLIISNIYCKIVNGGVILCMGNLVFLHMPNNLRNGCLAFFNVAAALATTLSAFCGGLFMKATDGMVWQIGSLTLQNSAYICFMDFAFVLLTAVFVFICSKLLPDTSITDVQSTL